MDSPLSEVKSVISERPGTKPQTIRMLRATLRKRRSRKKVSAPKQPTKSRPRQKAVVEKTPSTWQRVKDVGLAMGKRAISGGLDAAAMVEPAFIPVRAGIRELTGFSERTVVAGGASNNGEVVSVADAPVAFKRNPISTGWKLMSEKNGISRFWVRDLVSVVATGTANTFSNAITKYFGPTSDLFPNFYTQFEDFIKWRPCALKLHYVHFAPTSVQAAVMLWWVPQLRTSGGDAARIATTVGIMGNEFAVQGSAYEDFAIEVTPSDWDEGTWLFNYTGIGTAGTYTQSQLMAGFCGLSIDANPAATANIGYMYAEAEFEACDRAIPYYGAGLARQALSSYFRIKSDSVADDFLTWSLQQLADKARVDRKKSKDVDVFEELDLGELHSAYRKMTIEQAVPPPDPGVVSERGRLPTSALASRSAPKTW